MDMVAEKGWRSYRPGFQPMLILLTYHVRIVLPRNGPRAAGVLFAQKRTYCSHDVFFFLVSNLRVMDERNGQSFRRRFNDKSQ